MTRFSECFFLIFGQIAVGGVVGLAVPDFRTLERGFYKSSAGIFLGFGAIFVSARVFLTARGDHLPIVVVTELLVWSGFLVALGLYLASLWTDEGSRRARWFAASVLLGVAALVASAAAYRPPNLGGVPLVGYALPFLTGAAMLGGVTAGMLLGHWYLIDLGLSIEPLRDAHRFFVRATGAHVLAMAAVLTLAWVSGTTGASAAAEALGGQRSVLLTRLCLGPVPTLAIAWLIHRVLQIPQTMAATGLFYVAILFAMVGEMVGRLMLFRTGLPL